MRAARAFIISSVKFVAIYVTYLIVIISYAEDFSGKRKLRKE